MPVKPFLVGFCFAALFAPMLLGNDGAAEIALGGIRLKQERRVAMVKERLYISKKKVRVEYEFRNESDQDVTTEVAFPIPEYRWGILGWEPFDSFKVWVDGVERTCQIEAKAFVGGKEVTDTLRGLGIRIETLGDFVEGTGIGGKEVSKGGTASTSQLETLPKVELDRLIALGAVDGDTSDYRFRHLPRWTVRKTYHWTQRFAPDSVTRVTHEYKPAAGDVNNTTIEDLKNPRDGWFNFGAEGPCVDAGLVNSIKGALAKRGKPAQDSGKIEGCFGASWVRYILTTANTWKTPIRDFELVIDRDPGEFVTFCWDGPVEKVAANTFRARVKDFIPSKELTVYFLQP